MQDGPAPPQRLDSWKEIAAYLGRDVRTAMRWAKSQGLPVRRVAGGKGHSVFAFAGEIDEWLKGSRSPDRIPQTPHSQVPDPVQSAARRIARWTIAIAVLIGAVALAERAVPRGLPSASGIRVSFENDAVVLRGPHGYVRTVRPFEPSTILNPLTTRPYGLVAKLDDDAPGDVLVSTSLQLSTRARDPHSGALACLTLSGALRWRFEFDDTVRFADRSFSAPWTISDWEVSPGPGRRQIAIVAHHNVWWPGILALLDGDGRRLSTFVTSGWIENVQWLDKDRLVISGFDNARDGGMMAVIDVRHPNGHSPAGGDPTYACKGCLDGDPLAYVVFPRSELNTAASAPFNRAKTQLLDGGLITTTFEAGEPADEATAIYEFDSSLRYLRASYADHYWELHHRLEVQGVIRHTGQDCPEKSPGPIQSWTPGRGWRVLKRGDLLIE